MLRSSKPKDSAMTRLAHAPALHLSVTTLAGPGLMARLRGHFARLHEARDGQARLATLKPETLVDTGLSPEDLTGAPSYDPALPFFMQASFGRNDR
jgi:uncharacterized protein YjiS (DUF1127 family)